MKPEIFYPGNLMVPQILAETPDFLLVYKPPKMHSAPGKGESLAEWCAEKFPEIRDVREGECGLLFRLDYETHGLMLFARNRDSFNILFEEQARGGIIKEYGALVSRNPAGIAGFPRYNGVFILNEKINSSVIKKSFVIESHFRPYGPGSREVRPLPVIDDPGNKPKKKYQTEILKNEFYESEKFGYVNAKITKGFRHQIRCHLAWAGCPVVNDPIYGGLQTGKGILGLRAGAVMFSNPCNGEKVYFSLPDLKIDDI